MMPAAIASSRIDREAGKTNAAPTRRSAFRAGFRLPPAGLQAAVGAGTDQRLVDLESGYVRHRHNLIHLVGLGHLGCQAADIVMEHLRIGGVGSGNTAW